MSDQWKYRFDDNLIHNNDNNDNIIMNLLTILPTNTKSPVGALDLVYIGHSNGGQDSANETKVQ